MSQAKRQPMPHTNEGSGSDTSGLILEDNGMKKSLIAEIEVRSNEQPHMSLGTYTSVNPPKGFVIQITPDPEPETIVTHITRLETGSEYELMLHIANYGGQTVSAEVWQL